MPLIYYTPHLDSTGKPNAERLLRRLGVTGKLSGFRYAVYMVEQVRDQPDNVLLITKRLYYLGNTYNFKTTKKSYKSKKTICNPENQQAVFEHTPLALIDNETWELVQKNCQSRRRPTKIGDI